MTLREELDEAVARAILTAWGPQCTDCDQEYPAGCGCAHDAAKAANDAALSFLAARRLKAVGREATAGMIGAGWIDKEDVAPEEIWWKMHEQAPDLFSEADDAG